MKLNPPFTRWLGLVVGISLFAGMPASLKLAADEASAAAQTDQGGTDRQSAAFSTTSDNIVRIGSNAEVKAGERVNGDFVVIFGNATLDGDVDGDMVVVFGHAMVNGKVGGDFVNVMGSTKLGPNADLRNDCVVVGGRLDRDPAARLARPPTEVNFGGLTTHFDQLGSWFQKGFLLGRPLPPTVGWVWGIVLLHFLVYLITLVLLPKPVGACVKVLDDRPLTAFFVGLLGLILLAPVMFILIVSGIGIIIVPFVGLALMAAKLVGRTACFQYIGAQLLRRGNPEAAPSPLLAFLVGSVLVTLLYMVPILGFVVLGVLTPFSLGAALLAAAGAFRRDNNGKITPPAPPVPPAPLPGPFATAPVAPAIPPAAVTAGIVPAAMAVAPAPPAPTSPAAESASAPVSPLTSISPTSFTPAAEIPPSTPPTSPPPIAPGAVPPLFPGAGATAAMDFARLPRAGFWLRFAAVLLDLILVTIVTNIIVPHLPIFRYLRRDLGVSVDNPAGLLIWLAYHVGMWMWRGTTIGGIICSLKVVRVDGRPLDFGVALVRALGSIFSFVALGIGFFWAGWSSERQSWHDKIAGTTIVKVPKGVSLI
jgi:uncharacterized RDD family membrane protein YckC